MGQIESTKLDPYLLVVADFKFGPSQPPPMSNLSKSKLLAFRQCPKRLWLEIHKPELKEDSAATTAAFRNGNQVGEVARQIYDPAGIGITVSDHLKPAR
jgi:hypothetical protein